MALLLPGLGPVPVQAQSAVLPPVFSVGHGYVNAPFALTLTTATAGAQIRYTTDFTTPTANSGTLYTGPIAIDKTTVVRAVAYSADANQSATVTQSYIFIAQVRTQSNTPGGAWPAFFAPNNSDGGPYPAYYEMAPEIVNHASNTRELESALLSLPAISLVTDQPNLWDAAAGIYVNAHEKGRAWERPVSLEWMVPGGNSAAGFTVNAGVRIHGQGSRRPHRTPKKTFRLYFRSDYGLGKLNYPIFAAEGAVTRFDRILLRNGGNRSYPYFDRDQRREADYINDEFSRRSFLAMGGLAAHGTYVHLYLNGQYWGLYNVTERMDGEFLAAYGGGAEADYDLIQPDEDQNYEPAADPGTLDAWNDLHALVDVPTVTDSLYQQVLARLNVVDLADYMVLLHYIANTDWPAHNWYTYRKRSGPDTRFHLIPWDADTSLNNLNENMTVADAPGSPARLFHKLMTHPDFRQLVADRFYAHLIHNQGALTPAACTQRYGELANMVDLAMIGEAARWGAYASKIYPQMTFTAVNKALPAYLYSRSMSAADSDPGELVNDNQQKNWTQVRDAKLNSYCPQRTGIVLAQYVANGWYQTAVQAPTFSPIQGSPATGETITIDNAANGGEGTIYYTLDGSDPRAAGGTMALAAIDGGDLVTVTLASVTTLRARVLANGLWSPLQERVLVSQLPSVTLIHPSQAMTVTVNTPVALQAAVRGAAVEQVAFYVDSGTPLCTIASAAYLCPWQPTTAGVYTVKATAYHATGTVDSPAVTITVIAETPAGEHETKLYLPMIRQ
ncbi:MAG: CotH kinase family protein [Caldilineaceae bacterium]|nr:CotH kinase family protein [Caldilineaceae bacterium]